MPFPSKLQQAGEGGGETLTQSSIILKFSFHTEHTASLDWGTFKAALPEAWKMHPENTDLHSGRAAPHTLPEACISANTHQLHVIDNTQDTHNTDTVSLSWSISTSLPRSPGLDWKKRK